MCIFANDESLLFFQQRIVGQNCVVSDPLYGYSFDFNKLRKADADYLVTSGEYAYELNVCGPLVKSSKCTDSSIASCQTKPADNNFHYDAGMCNIEADCDWGKQVHAVIKIHNAICSLHVTEK